MMLPIDESYDAIRTTVGVIDVPGRSVIAITGPDRSEAVRRLLAVSTEFAAIDTCTDSLLLDESGRVVGFATALIGAEAAHLVVDAEPGWAEVLERAVTGLDATAARRPDLHALHVEGPRSWEVVAHYTGATAIEDVLLGETLRGRCGDEPVLIARTGSTAEFGYLMVFGSGVRDRIEADAREAGGGLIDPGVLPRIHVETNFPVLPQQVQDATVLEAGIAWFATLDRQDDFVGDVIRDVPAPHRRVVAARLDGEPPALHAEVRDAGTCVGRVQVVAPRAGRPDSVVLLLLDDPFGVPGLDLEIEGRTVRTLARPAISPRSWSEIIGG